MRIIAGKHKGRKLTVSNKKSVKSINYRPTTDFLRETLFNIISHRIEGCVFADVFAGCGSVGIEALSRGCAETTFVENNPENIKVINKNLELISQKADIIESHAVNFLKNPDKKYDIVFIDPPYYQDYENICVFNALNSNILKQNGILVLQHHISVKLEIKPIEKRKYIPNVLSFYKK